MLWLDSQLTPDCKHAFLMGSRNTAVPRLAEFCPAAMRELPQEICACIFDLAVAPDGKGEYPLSFLMQVNLADVGGNGRTALPNDGLLSFFYDTINAPWGCHPSHIDSCRVIYTPAEDLADTQPRTPPVVYEAPAKFRYNPDDFLARHGSTPRPEELQIDSTFPEMPISSFVGIWHRFKLLGVADILQLETLELEAQCQVDGLDWSISNPADVAAARTKWVLLMQLAGWNNGLLYFLIPREDLAAKDFSGVKCVFQK